MIDKIKQILLGPITFTIVALWIIIMLYNMIDNPHGSIDVGTVATVLFTGVANIIRCIVWYSDGSDIYSWLDHE